MGFFQSWLKSIYEYGFKKFFKKTSVNNIDSMNEQTEDNGTLSTPNDSKESIKFEKFIVKKSITDETLKKFIVKKAFNHETQFGVEVEVDPKITTIEEFAQLFLDKLSRRCEYSIDNTDYTLLNHVIHSDFKFIMGGIQFSSSKYSTPNKLLCQVIKKARLEGKDNITVHCMLSVYGKRNYNLNGHIKRSPRKLSDLCFFKLQDMIDQEQISKNELREALPNEVVLPENLSKLIM